jgi:hypothetical protein
MMRTAEFTTHFVLAIDPPRTESPRHASESIHPVQTFRYLPPSRLAGFDTRSEQGLDQIIYIQTLIEED